MRPSWLLRFLSYTLLGTALWAAGCAYSFNPSLPSYIKTLQIPTVDNLTLEPTLSQELTDALSERFIADNQLRVTPRDADAVLEAQVIEYQNRVFGITSDSVADQYLVILRVKMRLRDRVKNRDLWSDDGIEGRASYVVRGAQTGQTLGSEAEARAIAIRQVVNAAVSKTLEGW